MESGVHASVPLRVGKKMRKRRELDALVGGGGGRSGRLLSASSDEGEPWVRRSIRRKRTRPFVRFAAALGLCVCVVSAVTVLWLFVDVRRQIVSLRNEMDRVSTTSDGVGDALQLCHTAVKLLRTNATELGVKLEELKQQHLELAKRVDLAAGELASVSEQLSAAPKLADTPRRLAELQRTVADFGSQMYQINEFDSALKAAHKEAVAATAGVDELKTLLHQLEATTNQTIDNVTISNKKDAELDAQLVALNNTLVERLDKLQGKIEEATRTKSTTSSTTSTTPTSTSSTTTTSTTTAAPPVPPVKPNVTTQ